MAIKKKKEEVKKKGRMKDKKIERKTEKEKKKENSKERRRRRRNRKEEKRKSQRHRQRRTRRNKDKNKKETRRRDMSSRCHFLRPSAFLGRPGASLLPDRDTQLFVVLPAWRGSFNGGKPHYHVRWMLKPRPITLAWE